MNNLIYSLLMDKKDPKVYADSPEGRLKNADIQSEGWCTKGEVIGDIAQVIAPFAWAKLSKAGECVKAVEVASEGEKSVALAEEGIGAASKVEKTAEVTSKAGKITEGGSGSVYDNLSPKTGTDWNNYFINKYGQENVHWNLNSVDDIWSDPTRMVGYSENEMASVLGDGWTRGAYVW